MNANNTNRNFFSKDTVVGTVYDEPLIDGYRGEFGFHYINGVLYPIVRKIIKFDGNIEYTLIDRGEVILNSYWDLLSKQAVVNGAGVVKLFFDEVEEEKRTKVLYNKNRSWVGRFFGATKERFFSLASTLYGVSVPYDLAALDGDLNLNPVPDVLPKPPVAGAPQASTPPAQNPAPPQPQPEILRFAQDDVSDHSESGIVTEPSSRGRSGASTPNTPSSAPALPPAVAPATSSPPSDTTPPDISISVSQCAGSLSSGGCLAATTTLGVSWSSTADDADHYVVECLEDGIPCAGFAYDLYATSTAFSAEDGSRYTFRAKAADAAGNESAFVSQDVEVNLAPVVISEIAWAGTGPSNTADEWIELYNRSGQPVPLSGWVLRSATDDKPYLNLSGAIPANGYYLIERTDDTTVSDVTAGLIAPFGSGAGVGLVDSGEQLVLEYASTTMDETPAVGACGFGKWCGGGTFDRSTMERVDPDLSGSDPASWGSNNAIIRNGHGADGAALNGTPKARNSRNYYISQTNSLTVSKTLTKAGSPYFVDGNGLTISAGVTLTIEPGAVIKFGPNAGYPSMNVSGRIQALGTTAEPIVFTSFYDDVYGGNLDGTSTAPQAGDWRTILVNGSPDASTFEHALFRYGGGLVSGWGPPPEGANSTLSIMAGNFAVRHAVFEYSGTNGLTLLRSSGEVSDSVFRENIGVHASGPYGLIVGGGAVVVRTNRFEHNSNGLAAYDGPHQVLGNAFIGNIGQAVSFGSSDPSGTPTFSGNTASGNGTNGAAVSGTVNDYAFEKDLPYVVGALAVPAGKQVTIKPGAVLKMRSGFVPVIDGTLRVLGTADDPVVFTSLKDDEHGGDTNGDGVCDPGNASSTAACPSPGDWHSITIGPTSASSTLEHVIVRYGAACSLCGGFPFAAIKVEGTSVAISHALFEKNKSFGLWLVNSAATTIAASVFRDHSLSPGVISPVGLVLNAATTTLDGVTFSRNEIGIAADGASRVLVGAGGVSFDANTTDDSPADLIP